MRPELKQPSENLTRKIQKDELDFVQNNLVPLLGEACDKIGSITLKEQIVKLLVSLAFHYHRKDPIE